MQTRAQGSRWQRFRLSLLALVLLVPIVVAVPHSPAVAAPGDASASDIVRIANEEHRRWNFGQLKECTTLGRQIIVDDYWPATWFSDTICDASGEISDWSAAFISFVAQRAGASRSDFGTPRHWEYIEGFFDEAAASRSALYTPRRPADVAPKLGDLVCGGRGDNSHYTYDTMASSARQGTGYLAHCDFVVEVNSNSIRMIGGNVDDNVDDKTLTLVNGRVRGPNRDTGDAALILSLNSGGGSGGPAGGGNTGRPAEGTRGQIRGHAGLCLDLPYNDTTNGTNLWMWTCNTGQGQQWSFTDGEFRVSGKCLDIEGTEREEALVQITTCGYTGDLNWYMTNAGEIRTARFPGLCLDVQYAGVTSRTPVWMYGCNGTSAQRWTFPHSSGGDTGLPAENARGNITGHAGQCLDLPGNNATIGRDVVMKPCTQNASQQWSFNSGQFMINGKCLDIEGVEREEAVAQINNCGSTANLDWYMTGAGEIRTARFPGLCLDVEYAGTSSGTPVWMFGCNGSSAQKWNFPVLIISAVASFYFEAAATNALHLTSTCLAGNGRIDVNVVNITDEPERYVVRIGSLPPRQTTVQPKTWWRSPVTGRPDGPIVVTVERDGVTVLDETVHVHCDSSQTVSWPEVQFLTWCIGDRGMIAAQIANPTNATKAYVLDVEGIRRSTSAQAFGAAFRGISGRADGVYEVQVESAGEEVRSSTVVVDCS